MECPSVPANLTLLADLGSNFLGNTTGNILQAITCGGLLGSDFCTAICPNQDLAGIGVRVAFYFQSLDLAEHRKVVHEKASGQLTLHHATLVLNFSTLSCISSLAVAPTLPIWRLSPTEYSEQERNRHALTLAEDEASKGLMKLIETSFYNHVHRQQAKAAQERARVVLSLAILLQVVMQWAWAIFLFVSPYYGQPECSGDTVVVMFLAPFRTRDINSFDGNGLHFLVWPMWLLFCVGVTLALAIILAVSSSFRANEEFSRPSASGGSGATPATPAPLAWAHMVRDSLPPWRDRRRQFVFWCNCLSFAVWGMLVAASEWQIVRNCIFPGENNFGGLGQITAVFVSLVPLWSLVVALYNHEMQSLMDSFRGQAYAPVVPPSPELPTLGRRTTSVRHGPREMARRRPRFDPP
ncbi:hypothetical protein PHLGIDRAFT_130428 [Phlebiopsis gigantea 11061_1 CR5-6]|uniref:Uncharacterized protein n=1 Tax=Phlebiopsis gigantea (strain 11061_1 CR5-6) TaxID=745531 RepID=A0A0C3PCT1_PHLG1|nr:hypothetical protein PHLGIDRAFT_130428 [Phlebiopsis gigantea 11061_1 CR5-6]